MVTEHHATCTLYLLLVLLQMTREQILQEFPQRMLSLSFAVGEGQVQASTLRADPERTLDNIVALL